MKIKFVVFLLMILLVPATLHAETAKDAIQALKKLQMRTETGVSYREYPSILSDTKYTVKMYVESPEGALNSELSKLLLEPLNHFESALTIWKDKFSTNKGNCPSNWLCDDDIYAVTKVYSDAPVHIAGYTKIKYLDIDETISFLWAKGKKDIDKASLLLGQVEKDNNIKEDKKNKELEILQASNISLKNDNDNLRKDNDNLRKDIESLRQEIDLYKKSKKKK